MSEEERSRQLLRQLQREREQQHRDRLKEVVNRASFDGRSTTDFYGFGKILGEGSFAKVRLAYHRLAGCKVAIKSYEKGRLRDQAHWRRVAQEVKIMERLNHPYITRFMEMIDSPKRIHIVMEFAGGGNLCSYVKAKKRLAENEARKIFLQLVLAVEYMHSEGLIHRDIKLENVLFDSRRDMKLVDFGFSTSVRDHSKKLKVFCGTPSYMAPEIVQRKEYLGRPVDVWSLGVLLFACLCGHFPFTAKTYPDLYKKIAEANLRVPDYLSSAARDLLRRMLHPDPLKRLSLARVKRHPWVTPLIGTIVREVQTPLDRSLLISDDPADDAFEAALRKGEELGLPRKRVLECVLGRKHDAFTTTYYLLLYRYGRSQLARVSKAQLEADARAAAAEAGGAEGSAGGVEGVGGSSLGMGSEVKPQRSAASGDSDPVSQGSSTGSQHLAKGNRFGVAQAQLSQASNGLGGSVTLATNALPGMGSDSQA